MTGSTESRNTERVLGELLADAREGAKQRDKLFASIDGLRSDINGLKSDIASVKFDVANTKSAVEKIKPVAEDYKKKRTLLVGASLGAGFGGGAASNPIWQWVRNLLS